MICCVTLHGGMAKFTHLVNCREIHIELHEIVLEESKKKKMICHIQRVR